MALSRVSQANNPRWPVSATAYNALIDTVNALSGTVTSPVGAAYNVMSFMAPGRVEGTTDDSSACQSAVDAAGTTGGVVFWPGGHVYRQDTPLLLPRANTSTLVLSGYGATIKVTGAGFTALDYDTAGASFDHFIIEGFHIECTSIVTSGNPGVIDFYPSTVFEGTGCHNSDDLTIRDILIDNLPTSATDAYFCTGVRIVSTQDSGYGETHLTNIHIERVKVVGGYTGFSVCGGGNDPWDVIIDNITIRDCWHDTMCAYTSSTQGANIQTGSRGKSGRILIDGFYGNRSADVGIEADAGDSVVVRNATIKNCKGTAFYTTSFNFTAQGSPAHVLFDNCHFIADSVEGGVGFGPGGNGAEDFGLATVVQRDCSATVAVDPISGANASPGISMTGTTGVEKFYVDGFVAHYALASPDDTYPAGPISLDPDDAPYVNMRRIAIEMVGAVKNHSYGMRLGGTGGATYDLDGLEFIAHGTGVGGTNIHVPDALIIGRDWICNLHARIKNVRTVGAYVGIGTEHGIEIWDQSGTSTLDVTIEDCDLTSWTNGQVVTSSLSAPNMAKVVVRNVKSSIPKTPGYAGNTITVGSSPFTYTAALGYDEWVTVVGGTVSAIALYMIGGDYMATGATSGAFFLRVGDKLRVTYSSAPTMYHVPREM